MQHPMSVQEYLLRQVPRTQRNVGGDNLPVPHVKLAILQETGVASGYNKCRTSTIQKPGRAVHRLALRDYYICVSASIDSETVPLCVLECALLDTPLCAIGVHGLVYISSSVPFGRLEVRWPSSRTLKTLL